MHVTPSNSEIKPTRTSRRRHIHKPAIDHREDAHPAPVITSSPSSSTQLFSNKTNYPPLSDSHTNSESQYGDTNGYLNYHSEDISFNSQNSEVLRAYSREALEEDQSMLESMKNFVNLSESMTNSPASIMESNNPSQESDLIIQAKEELLPVEHKSDIKIDENDESRPNSKSSHRNGNLQKDLSDLSKRFTALKRKYNIVCDNLAKSERDRQKLLAQRRQVNAVSSTARVISEPSVATHSNIDVSSDDTINSLPRSSSEKVMEEMNTIEAGRAREVDALRMRLNQQEEELIVAYKELEEVKRLPKHNVTVVKPPITKKSTEAVSEPTKPTKSRISDLFSNFGQMKSSKKAKSRRKLKVDSGADEGSPEQTELTKKERDIIELRQAVDTLSLAVSTLESENAQLVTTAERETDTLRKQLIQLKEEYQADADRLVELLTIR